MKEKEADISNPSRIEVEHAWRLASIPSIYLYDVEHDHKDIFILVKIFHPDNSLYYTVLILFNVFRIPALRKMGDGEGSASSCYMITYSILFLLPEIFIIPILFTFLQ